MTDAPYVTPVVARLAASRGVDLRLVAGTGAGGRISKADVLAASATGGADDSWFDEPQGFGADFVAAVRASASAGRVAAAAARGPAWARNPLVDVARQMVASTPGAPRLGGAPPPTLFVSGDLPPFTSSGVDPQTLLEVPAAARHPMAEAETPAAAMAILNAYAGPNGGAAAANDFRWLDGNLDYEGRVLEWVRASLTRDQQLSGVKVAAEIPWPS